MATIVAGGAAARHAPGRYDRAFYSGMAVLMALIIVAGFAPTYYLRGYVGSSTTFSGVVTLNLLTHVHGALFTGWLVLFIVQTALVAGHRVALHRRLGIAGVVLVAAMITVGFRTAVAAAGRGSAPPGIDPMAFLIVPLFDLVLLAGFVTAAMRMRRNKEAHKRLMLLAYISILTPGIARLPGVMAYGPPAFFGLTILVMLIGFAYDLWSRGRVHPAYVWGGAVLVASVPLRLAISGTQAWRTFAEMLVR